MKRFWLVLVPAQILAATASPDSCAPCHRSQTASFAHSDMTSALETVKQCEVLRSNPDMTVKIGTYSYEIKRDGEQSIYTVTDGSETIRVPLAWVFGLGSAGQTYLFEKDGLWYESRVSYFATVHGLDLTLGAQSIRPRNLMEAAGRLSGRTEVGQCFDCHATQAVKGMDLTLDRMIPGIQCERCHGSTQDHPQSTTMRPLGQLTSEETSEFCGQCHRTWSQIALKGPRGIENVRFQPYRLTNSKCYSSDDNRIACTTCHDPHQALVTSTAFYDVKCTACHSTANSSQARICTVAKKDCVTCHMPRLELPGSHKLFTDHQIRIVKANEKYPD